MVWRVRWTTLAWNDVEAASGFIARDSPRYAVILQREAQAAAKSLRHFSKRGRIVPERNDERLRELIVGSHRLLYKIIGDDEVVVIAFVHSARDLATFLENKNR